MRIEARTSGQRRSISEKRRRTENAKIPAFQ
jgi:hypothetical protein